MGIFKVSINSEQLSIFTNILEWGIVYDRNKETFLNHVRLFCDILMNSHFFIPLTDMNFEPFVYLKQSINFPGMPKSTNESFSFKYVFIPLMIH